MRSRTESPRKWLEGRRIAVSHKNTDDIPKNQEGNGDSELVTQQKNWQGTD